MTFEQVVSVIEETLGQKWPRLTFDEWKSTFKNLSADNPMFPLFDAYFAKPTTFPSRTGNYDCSNTLAFGSPPPAITKDLIKKYTNYWTANLYK